MKSVSFHLNYGLHSVPFHLIKLWLTLCGAQGILIEVSTIFTLLRGESELAVDAVSLQQRKNKVVHKQVKFL